MVIIKGEIIHGENHANEVTECASGNGFVGGFCVTRRPLLYGEKLSKGHPPTLGALGEQTFPTLPYKT